MPRQTAIPMLTWRPGSGMRGVISRLNLPAPTVCIPMRRATRNVPPCCSPFLRHLGLSFQPGQIAFQLVVPFAGDGGRAVGRLQESHQLALGVIGLLHRLIGKKELALLLAKESLRGLDRLLAEVRRSRVAIGIKYR